MTNLAKIIRCVSTFAVLIAGISGAHAQSAPPALEADERRTVVETAAEVLRNRYVFPDVGERAAAALETALADGRYDDLTNAAAFAQRLTDDLRPQPAARTR